VTSGGDTTNVGAEICGTTNGCIAIYKHPVRDHDDDVANSDTSRPRLLCFVGCAEKCYPLNVVPVSKPVGLCAMYRSISGGFLFLMTLATSGALAQPPALLLFGDANHKTFLGCLNCSQFDSGSICNQSGQNGSEFSGYSIWNRLSNFGNAFSSYSPWNQYSSSGPIIVDKDGHFYGQLTANRFAVDRTQIQRLNQLTDMVAYGHELEAVRNLFCGQ